MEKLSAYLLSSCFCLSAGKTSFAQEDIPSPEASINSQYLWPEYIEADDTITVANQTRLTQAMNWLEDNYAGFNEILWQFSLRQKSENPLKKLEGKLAFY